MQDNNITKAAVAHTAGPWRIQRRAPDLTSSIVRYLVASDGQSIACTVGLPDVTDEGNALLMAAAPDLLEACSLFTTAVHEVRDLLNERGLACPASIAHAAAKARHAIAKGTGL